MAERFGRKSVVTEVREDGDDAAADPVELKGTDEKYEFEGSVGAGGMGEVLLVRDRDLRRQVAMKVLHEEIADHAEHRLRFVGEAQATSQLSHPGIPPVYDLGVSPDGRVYFTMKLVAGDTLHDVIWRLAEGDAETAAEYTLHRRMSVLERICEAVHFAHEKGTLHRDLKPENVTLGAFGEVYVMDWGLAKHEGVAEQAVAERALDTAGSDAGLNTQVGVVKGTLPYMSPEQLRGRVLDRRSDVYALGCMLYEMLALRAAFEGTDMALFRQVLAGEFVPVAERCDAPQPLTELCARAMAKDRDSRPTSAQAMAATLRAWLDGRAEAERRHAEAERLAAQGKEAAERFQELRRAAAEAETAADAAASEFEPSQSFEEKRPLYVARERVVKLRDDLVLAMADATNLFQAALVAEPGNPTAAEALCDLWRSRMEQAERAGDRNVVVFAEANIRRHDTGRLEAFLRGDGSLELTSDPPGARVTLHRFEDDSGVLQASEGEELGTTPLGPVTLPMGSYLCLLRLDGYRDVRYPVHIPRQHHWKGAARMRTDEEIGEGFVYVPGGPFVFGEDDAQTVLELPDFAIARAPVTMAQWAEYVHAVEDEEGPEVAEALALEITGVGHFLVRGDDGRWRANPKFFEDPIVAARHGADYAGSLPVLGVSWHDAEGYCAWMSRTTGQQWRLPTSEEREKAARGVDGRRFPWGDADDPSLGLCMETRLDDHQPEPVDSVPSARSLYGMVDAAGGAWEWSASWADERQTTRLLRGGSWSHTARIMRCAYRFSSDAGFRSGSIGFRVARSLPE